MTYIIPDLDIDVKDRDEILKNLKYIPASKISETDINPHNVGVYFCDVPQDLITGLASIDYKRAETEFGYIKVDVLHNTLYNKFSSRSEIKRLMNEPIKWELLKNANVVETLPHIGSYYNLLMQLPSITSVIELAYFISIIRPGKKHLIQKVQENRNWECIKDEIWVKDTTEYMYKKSHALSYALSISLLLH